MTSKLTFLRTAATRKVVQKKCNEADFDYAAFVELLGLEHDHLGKQQKRDINKSIEEVLQRMGSKMGSK